MRAELPTAARQRDWFGRELRPTISSAKGVPGRFVEHRDEAERIASPNTIQTLHDSCQDE